MKSIPRKAILETLMRVQAMQRGPAFPHPPKITNKPEKGKPEKKSINVVPIVKRGREAKSRTLAEAIKEMKREIKENK